MVPYMSVQKMSPYTTFLPKQSPLIEERADSGNEIGYWAGVNEEGGEGSEREIQRRESILPLSPQFPSP